jgi:anti-anti-sigma factor
VDAQSPTPTSTPVILSGSLDQYSAESLKQQLLGAMAAPMPEICLEMSEVDHIDAAALQVLLACKAGLKQEKLRIKGADPSVQQWLRIAGADSAFDFSDVGA